MSLRDILDEYFGEFHTRFAGRHYGKFRAVVVRVDDPKQLGRIKVKCPHLFGDSISGWCWPSSAMGANDAANPHGFVSLPEQGAVVWIELEEGNTGRPPLWTSGAWSAGSIPDHVRAVPDEADLGIRGIAGGAIPPSSANFSEYGKVRTWQMPSGARIEFDETEGEERVFLYHRSGSMIEMLSDGTIQIGAATGIRVQASAGNFVKYVANTAQETVDGALIQTIGTTWKLTADQQAEVNTGGPLVVNSATYDLTVAGDFTFTVGTYSGNVTGNYGVSVANQMSIGAGTDMFLQASGAMQIVGQNNVTNGGIPTDLGTEVAAYNSRAEIYSTDATGVAVKSGAEFDGVLGTDIFYNAGPVRQGGFNVNAFGIVAVDALTLLQLGGGVVQEPVLKGVTLTSLLTTIFALIDAHTHLGNLGIPTSPAAAGVPPLATSAVWGGGATALSLKVTTE